MQILEKALPRLVDGLWSSDARAMAFLANNEDFGEDEAQEMIKELKVRTIYRSPSVWW